MKPDIDETYEVEGRLLARLHQEQQRLIHHKMTESSKHDLEKVIELILMESEIIIGE